MSTRKPTSLDIAALAGVSQSTVSRALRDSPQVAPETRQRIQSIARELNYQVDHVASSLRSGQTRTLALLLFEDEGSDESHINPFFLSMMGSIARTCAARDYDLLLSFQQLSEDWYARYEEAHRADGLILLGYGDYTRSRQNLERLAESGAHFVLWGPQVAEQPGVSVGCDNVRGGLEATRHLLALGRNNIAFLGTASEQAPEFYARYHGYERALVEAGIPSPAGQVDAENSESSGAHAVKALLEDNPDIDALFCASDLIAIGAINALRDQGIDVPRTISVVGFDDIGAAAYCRPPLTTMRQDTLAAGEALVDTLLHLVAEGPAHSRLLRPSLVLRDSCAPATGPGLVA